MNHRCCSKWLWLARGEGREFLFQFSLFLFVCSLLMISINEHFLFSRPSQISHTAVSNHPEGALVPSPAPSQWGHLANQDRDIDVDTVKTQTISVTAGVPCGHTPFLLLGTGFFFFFFCHSADFSGESSKLLRVLMAPPFYH